MPSVVSLFACHFDQREKSSSLIDILKISRFARNDRHVMFLMKRTII